MTLSCPTLRYSVLARLFLATCALASALPVHAEWKHALGIAERQFTVDEYAPSGRRIVREQGWMPGVEARTTYLTGAWAWSAEAEWHGGDISYRGQTQFGAPASSSTGTGLLQLRSKLAYAFADAWSAFAALEWQRWRRDIRGTANAAGLNELTRSQRLLLGLEWGERHNASSPWSASAALVLARPERLGVRFSGLYDDAEFDTRSAVGARLGTAWRIGKQWQLHADFDWMRVPRSDDAPLTRNGAFAGMVAQPEHKMRSITLGLRYLFP
ncbi:hypothetical protein [Noviherbaspirillum pedocola]|uniref:Uncharacterized protein n=1 Tax=Noviherbaspirillum pedocola TaxID=2801341 RepID=A0A934STP2_9BURK|nr:hypothetical protein [Noviherbaspirillum pedocola]MBK4736410.1 hypothetical protein [Noviherbaspirillum pedocola]